MGERGSDGAQDRFVVQHKTGLGFRVQGLGAGRQAGRQASIIGEYVSEAGWPITHCQADLGTRQVQGSGHKTGSGFRAQYRYGVRGSGSGSSRPAPRRANMTHFQADLGLAHIPL